MTEDTGQHKKKKVIVVGVGTGGVGALHFLRKNNPEIDVEGYEALDFIGGRIGGDTYEDFQIDRAASLFLEGYKTIREASEDIGAPFDSQPKKTGGLVYKDNKMRYILPFGSMSDRLKTLGTILSGSVVNWAGLKGYIKFKSYCEDHKEQLSLDDVDVLLPFDTHADFLEWGKANDLFLVCDQFFRNDLRGYCMATSMSPALAVTVLYNLSVDFKHKLNMPSTGVGSFGRKMAEKYKDYVHVSTPVSEIVLQDGQVKGIKTQSGKMVEADAVICNAPANHAAAMLPDLPHQFRDLMSQIEYTSAIKLVLGTNYPIMPKKALATVFDHEVDTMISTIENSFMIIPNAMPPGKFLYHVVLINEFADPLLANPDDEAVTGEIMKELYRYYPRLKEEPPIFTRIYRWPEAGALVKGHEFTRVHTMLNKELPEQVKGLYFCGDWCFGPLTNAAMKTGKMAAEQCAAYLSQAN